MGNGVSQTYFNYLRTRSLSGLLYRKFWLYPVLVRRLRGRVLDVGCGIGDFLAYRPGTVGVDVNSHSVEWCRQRGLDARLMEPDHLPFENASFDGVILDNVLEHLESPQALLEEIRRVTVPEGQIIVGVPGKRGYDSDPDHKIYYDEQQLGHVMVQAGMVEKERFYMPFENIWLAERLSQYCLYGVFVRP